LFTHFPNTLRNTFMCFNNARNTIRESAFGTGIPNNLRTFKLKSPHTFTRVYFDGFYIYNLFNSVLVFNFFSSLHFCHATNLR